MNNEEQISTVIHKIFPKADIISTHKFSKGLVSDVYKVEILNPTKTLAIKFFPKKIETRVEKSAKISNYACENNIPSPHTYDIAIGDVGGSVVMDCLPGDVASEVWEKADETARQEILFHSGAMLRKIHDLDIPSFWIHHKHEVTSNQEWIEWTGLRIKKYIEAAKQNIGNDFVDFLTEKFSRLLDLYSICSDFRFVPMHWDYHLSNINVDESGKISGVFDFDNAMKGHDMADIGQTIYWLAIQQNITEAEMFDKFFAGYGELSEIDREFVELHFLLFLAGVMRSTWSKSELRWLNDRHVEVLKSFTKEEVHVRGK